MKNIILSIMTLITFLITSFSNSFANNNDPYLLTLEDAKIMIELQRKSNTSYYLEDLCYYVNSRSRWDVELIKRSFLSLANFYLWRLESHLNEIKKTRPLTEKELSDYNEIKRLFELEKRDPRRPSFETCDIFMEKFKDNLYNEVEFFKNNKKLLQEEYNDAIFTKKDAELAYYNSKILNTDVAVVELKDLRKAINKLLNYKAFIIQKTTSKWNIIKSYFFLKNITISDRITVPEAMDMSLFPSDYLAKIYKKLYPEMWERAWSKVAPIVKAGKNYYFYTIFR